MHLLAPLWWLLLLPLAGGIILLYMLKLRRRNYVVPSVFLWEQALQDLQANAPLQKLRKNLLMLLQLLVALLVVAALSRPALQWRRVGGQSVVLVIDASASMQSTDVSPSRFAAAQKEGHRAIEALGPRDRMMLIAIGGAMRALTPFTTDKRALNEALDHLRVTDARSDLRHALLLAAGLMRGKKAEEKPSILVISDGALPSVNLPPGFDLPVHFTKIGTRSENVGIVMMNVRQRLNHEGGYEGVIGMKNFGAHAQQYVLELSVNGKLRDARELSLAAGAQRTEVLQELPTDGGMLRAHLDIDDDLAVDNDAQVIMPKLEPVSVVLATTGNLFLQTALSLDPTLTVSTATTVPQNMAPGTLLVADNVPVAQLPRGVSALLIGTDSLRQSKALPAQVGEELAEPSIADWNRRHPVMVNADITCLHIASAVAFTPAPGALPLIEASGGTIALAADQRGQRLVALGWNLHGSDFPLRSAFPIFIANCIDWLSGQRQRAQVTNIHTGQAIQIPLPPKVDTAALKYPDGHTEHLVANGMVLNIEQVTKVGTYHVLAKNVDVPFTANLLDAAESDLLPRPQLALVGEGGLVRTAHSPLRTEEELWRSLLLLAFVLMAVEWWVFHRRIG